MTFLVKHIFDKFSRNPHQVFLVDAIGALLTSFLLGILLPNFQAYIGMPLTVLYVLASVAFVFAVYSMCCYFLRVSSWQPYLRLIALANLAYCLFSVIIVIYYYSQLTLTGLLYFAVETIIIIFLSYCELQLTSKKTSS